jgi:hypothetical protein
MGMRQKNNCTHFLGVTYLCHAFMWQVMSDWDATHSTEKAALNGLDQEMPEMAYFGYMTIYSCE